MKHLLTMVGLLIVPILALSRGEEFANDIDLQKTNEIKIMSYNVENLFDTTHDEGKSDWEFLPITSSLKKNCENQGPYKRKCYETDWTSPRLKIKLKQIKKVIDAQGSLPEILGLEEVENSEVIQRVAKELGYKRYLISNSPDNRGIDVALLFNEDKLRFLNSEEKSVPNMRTRNILVANFQISPQEVLGVYINHWPSQGKKSEARVEAANALRDFVEEQAQGRSNYHVVLMGDFNTIDSDNPHPFEEVILNPAWKRGFLDVHRIYDELKGKNVINPPGTYFYFKEATWNRLDKFFVSSSLADNKGVELVKESFRIVSANFMSRPYEPTDFHQINLMKTPFRVPKSYNHNADNEESAGFSDHFPIVMKLRAQ